VDAICVQRGSTLFRRERKIGMARFIVIHDVSIETTQDALIACARDVVASLAPGMEWLNSWWIAGEVQRLFCEWEAPDANAIRAALEEFEDLLPIETVHEAQWINPKWYT
jgi:hypothetical protein